MSDPRPAAETNARDAAGDDDDDFVDGCEAMLASDDATNDDDLPFVVLFAGVPEEEIETTAVFWRAIGRA